MLLLQIACASPPPTQISPELYGGGGIKVDGGVDGVAWAADGSLLVQRLMDFELAVVEPRTGTLQSVVKLPCRPSRMAGRTGFRWLGLRCGSAAYALDPLTSELVQLSDSSTSILMGNDLVVWDKASFEHYDASLAPTRSHNMPFFPSDAAAGGDLVVGIRRAEGGRSPETEVVWSSPRGDGHAVLGVENAVDVATDGTRIVIAHGSGISWLQASSGSWIGTTDLGTEALSGRGNLYFLGSTLWVRLSSGWRRFTSPTSEVSPLGACMGNVPFVDTDTAVDVSGVAFAGTVRVATFGTDGAPLIEPPPWLGVYSVSLSDTGLLATATDCGVTLIDRRTKRITQWRDGAKLAWISPDGKWIAATDAAARQVWFREVQTGRRVDALELPLDGKCGGYGCILHGGWSRVETRFIGSMVGSSHAESLAWEPGLGASPLTERATFGIAKTDFNRDDDLFVVAPDGWSVYHQGSGVNQHVLGWDPKRLPPTFGISDPVRDLAIEDDGDVVIIECDWPPPDDPNAHMAAYVTACRRRVLPDGPVAPLPVNAEARLSRDGSFVFVPVDDTHINVHDARGRLVATTTTPSPYLWPTHGPKAETSRSRTALAVGLQDGRIQVVDASVTSAGQ